MAHGESGRLPQHPSPGTTQELRQESLQTNPHIHIDNAGADAH